MSTSKVLVVGAIQGHFEKAFQKISKLHAKQNFSFAIIVGDLFASEDAEGSADLQSLLDGSISVPLPTYFSIGDSSLPEAVRDSIEANGEVCSNLFYLGRKGTLKTSEGVRIVNIGGRLVQDQASLTETLTNYDPLFLDPDANSLRGANSADILITNQWPARISLNSNTPVPETVDPDNSSESLARLCSALKPRYHFSSSLPSASKWEREPFLHPQSYEDTEQNTSVTRFVSLSSIASSTKDWMYAFTLDLSKPANTDGAQVISPLTFSPKRKRTHDHDAESNGFSRYDKSASSGPPYRQNNRSKRARYDPNDCFMCMGRPDFNTSMVVSISDESFITVLKGPLPHRATTTTASPASTFPTLQSSGHSMIIPMYHAASETANSKRTPQELQTEFDDMTQYRHSLNTMMSTQTLGAVCWEVNRTGIRHLHWQHIAAPPALIRNGLVSAAYKVAAEKAKYPPFTPCAPDTLIPDTRTDYFRVWIFQPTPPATSTQTPIDAADAAARGDDDGTDTGTETSMYFTIAANLKFNISFGREVMAGLLQLEHRSDWRSVPEGGEEEDAEAMKKDFAPFDRAMQ